MANTTGTATTWNCPNYLGSLFLVGQNQTPFLNMVGGLNGNNARIVGDFQFPVAVPWALNSASQPSITEQDSYNSLPTAVVYVREQDVNTCQIFQTRVTISYAKLATVGQATADATTKLLDTGETHPVTDEKTFQINGHMEQIALNVDHTFLNGTYQQATNATTAPKCQGIITACSTNSVAAGGATLSKDLVNELLRTMAGNGSRFRQPVIFCNAFQRQKISDLYGYAPEDREVGGVAISTLITDFARCGVAYAPNVPAASFLVADMAFCKPVFLPVPDKGILFYEPLAKTGAAEDGMLFGLIGLDYGPEEFHGKITGLATS